MIEDVSRLLESAMVDPSTGVHNPEVQEPPPLTPSTIADVLKDPILFDDNGDNGRCGLGRIEIVVGVAWGVVLRWVMRMKNVVCV